MENKLIVVNDIEAEMRAMIESNPKLQPTTKAQYTKAITNAINKGVNLADANSLREYSLTLPKSSKSFLKAAIRQWSIEMTTRVKSEATPENVDAVTASIYQFEALTEAFQVEDAKGQKAHTWLNQSQARQLLQRESQTVKGQRDQVVFGLLLGAGLRRLELSQLTFDMIIVQPSSTKDRTTLDIEGKGAKNRSIPINDKLADLLKEWESIVGGGFVARRVSRAGVIGPKLSPIGIFNLVRQAGISMSRDKLAPHDLRRTFARLGYNAGVDVAQIAKLLGHSSLKTTQGYLGIEIDLEQTVSDFIPF